MDASKTAWAEGDATAERPPPSAAGLRVAPTDITVPVEGPAPLCPVDRLPRRRRNKICIALIALGALNLVVFPVVYAGLGGDAHNGYRVVVERPDGSTESAYYLGGHYLRSLAGQERQVSRGVWVFSYLHSISLLLTSGAMVIGMLVLARPHIIATMRDGWISGQTFVTAFGTIVLFVTAIAVSLFVWAFVAQLA